VKLYCITRSLPVVAKVLEQGVDLVQIRAKDLPARELTSLVSQAVALGGSRILVNTRADVALACGAGGVHLPGDSIPPLRIRSIVPPGFLIGVSCHAIDELRRAEEEQADFAIFGPIFDTGGKQGVGLAALEQATRAVHMPVYALGGITWESAPRCIAAGAIGVAGISMFEVSES
jgi:thiamine-phosphate pyrophosphorylase